jgi:hypothetical protein
MRELIESGAARLAAGIHRAGANFDFEVLALPGGSVLALLLWLYASTLATVKRAAPKYRVAPTRPPVDQANGVRNAAGRLPAQASCVGCHCS